jgi:hypothetical protein
MGAQAHKKQAKRNVVIEEANPVTDLPACLGKVRYETEEAAIEQSSFRPYFCPWCDGYHTSAHGFKGSRRGR